jgi:hypothetical protein
MAKKYEEIAALIDQTFDPDPRMRKNALKEMCPCHIHANVPIIWERIIALVEDSDLSVRKVALHALGDGSPRQYEAQVIAAMEKLRNDPNVKLRKLVRKALARYRGTGKWNEENT